MHFTCCPLQRQQMLGNCSATLEVLTVIVASRIFAVPISKRTRGNLLPYGMDTHFVYSVAGCQNIAQESWILVTFCITQ